MLSRKIYHMVLLANIFFGFGIGLYGPVYAIFVKDLGGSLIDIGIAYSILLILQGLLVIPFGELTDRYGVRLLSITSTLFFALAAFLYAFWVKDVFSVFIVQAIIGISTAAGSPSWPLMLFNASGKSRRALKYGILQAGMYVGEGIAGIAGSAIAAYISFHALFVGVGVLLLASVFFIGIIKPDKLA